MHAAVGSVAQCAVVEEKFEPRLACRPVSGQLLVPVLEERLRRTMRRPIPRPEFGAIGAPDGRAAAAPYDQAAAEAAGADAAAEEEEDDGLTPRGLIFTL